MKVASLGATRDLGFNLIAWSAAADVAYVGEGRLELFAEATPQIMYNRQIFVGSMASAQGYCNQPFENPAFNFGTSSISATFPACTKIDPYTGGCGEYTCYNSMGFDPEMFGYDEQDPSHTLKVDLDMNSFAVATAVNLGVLSISTLIKMVDDHLLEVLLSVYVDLGWIS